MNKTEYMSMLYFIDLYYQKEPLIIDFENRLKVKCLSDTGMFETSAEPEDDDYIGEHITVVKVLEILEQGHDYSVPIFNNYIEISLICIPEKISLENGTVLWKKAHS